MSRALPSEFVAKLVARIKDPIGRTDGLDPSPTTSFLDGAFETRRVQLDGGPPLSPAPLPSPATDDDVASAQASLGFALPPDLEDLYRRVANGGFGPDDGLAPLETMVDRYRELADASPGDDGAEWPQHMVPIGLSGPGTDCYDIRSGRIVYWEEEESFDKEGEPIYRHSFTPEADTLQAWLEDWLSRPPFAEQMKLQMENALLENMRTTLAYWRAKSPEERAEYGLSADGWEEELFGHLGIDLSDL